MKQYKKITTSLIMVLFGLVVFVPFTHAAVEVEITCNPGAQSLIVPYNCQVTPDRNAPLFDPSADSLLLDLKPGDEIVRTMKVTNNRKEECFFELVEARVTKDTESTLGGKFFSEELKVQIKDEDGVDITGQISFADLFGSTPIYLGTLASTGDPSGGDIKDFIWTATFDAQAGNEWQLAELIFDFRWNFQCGEEPPETILFIEKTNNKLGIIQAPGDSVTYTLTIFTLENPVYNVFVIDLPPGGFTYRGGTWTAHSDIRGDLKGGGVTGEPLYASPGTWNLGNMSANETVTLTYVTDINSDQQSGEYPDIAWTEGTASSDPSSARVIGNEGSGFFVGTAAAIAQEGFPEVEVETNVEEDEIIEEEGDVLGISSELPATGADNIWAKIVGGVFGAGVLFVALGYYLARRSEKSTRVLTSLLVFAFSAVVLASGVFAAGLLIRIEEPESPNRLDALELNFVALDVENRAVTVKCYKQGPGDAVFTQFGSDIVLAPGGDSGHCNVTSGILSSDGTYKFYVTAQANGDNSTSPTVTIDHDSDRPGKPRDFDKNKNGSCKYDISFKTADDGGDTTRVEVYRSNDKEFYANASTRIKDIAVGSNQLVEFTSIHLDWAPGRPISIATMHFIAISAD
ncbi:LPXTG cell wall anchor domain-containing protein [bacterium]|nr:LPXTG cell wall anchor domain-containing protein [bacterium]